MAACEGYNGGKSNRERSDSSVLQKQHGQLAAFRGGGSSLSTTREQLEHNIGRS
jgi:hypothetical protein